MSSGSRWPFGSGIVPGLLFARQTGNTGTTGTGASDPSSAGASDGDDAVPGTPSFRPRPGTPTGNRPDRPAPPFPVLFPVSTPDCEPPGTGLGRSGGSFVFDSTVPFPVF